MTADATGRLTFDVDLGEPHAFQQYSPPARVQESAGGYWVSREIRFG